MATTGLNVDLNGPKVDRGRAAPYMYDPGRVALRGVNLLFASTREGASRSC